MSTATVSPNRPNGKPVAVAKFKGVCYLCDQPIAKGELVVPVKQMRGRTRWAHKACAEADSGVTAPVQSDASPPQDAVVKAVGKALGDVQARLAKLESGGAQPAGDGGTDEHLRKVVQTLAKTVTDLDDRCERLESATPRTIELKQ